MSRDASRWSRVRYSLWSPFYDRAVGWLVGARRESIRRLDPRRGERVLIVGAGTGADLPFFPPGCRVLATDLTRAMLVRARSRQCPGVELVVMDGQQLALPSGAFDCVVLHLVLAVVPDPAACLQEAARVLKEGGRAIVFDKFVRGHAPVPLRLLNLAARPLFTDLTRQFEAILQESRAALSIERDEPALLGGLFRHILLTKQAATSNPAEQTR